jgi:hypothetical protein
MKKICAIVAFAALAITVAGTIAAPRAAAQDPILTPIIVNEVAPIVVKTLTPKPKLTGVQKFEGYYVNGNAAQVTLRAKGNDLGIQTFALNQTASGHMQKIIDQGGYQYGDKVTIFYDPTSLVALKIKGKPSRPL